MRGSDPQAAVDDHYSMSEAIATIGAAKNEATRTADRYRRSALARVSPPTSSQERKRLMLSMPATPDNAPPCTEPHVDGCPGCVVNTEPPRTRESVGGHCQTTYACTDCGHEWTTAWWCG